MANCVPQVLPASLKACPFCLDDLEQSDTAAEALYACRSCGAVAIRVRKAGEPHLSILTAAKLVQAIEAPPPGGG